MTRQSKAKAREGKVRKTKARQGKEQKGKARQKFLNGNFKEIKIKEN